VSMEATGEAGSEGDLLQEVGRLLIKSRWARADVKAYQDIRENEKPEVIAGFDEELSEFFKHYEPVVTAGAKSRRVRILEWQGRISKKLFLYWLKLGRPRFKGHELFEMFASEPGKGPGFRPLRRVLDAPEVPRENGEDQLEEQRYANDDVPMDFQLVEDFDLEERWSSSMNLAHAQPESSVSSASSSARMKKRPRPRSMSPGGSAKRRPRDSDSVSGTSDSQSLQRATALAEQQQQVALALAEFQQLTEALAEQQQQLTEALAEQQQQLTQQLTLALAEQQQQLTQRLILALAEQQQTHQTEVVALKAELIRQMQPLTEFLESLKQKSEN